MSIQGQAPEPDQPKVLVLHAAIRDATWSMLADQVLQQAMTRRLRGAVDYYSE